MSTRGSVLGQLAAILNYRAFCQMDGFRIEWARKCLDLVSVIGNYKDAVWFQKPVDVKALHCPDYYQVVKQPRDLSMIKKKLKDLNYNSIATFKEGK